MGFVLKLSIIAGCWKEADLPLASTCCLGYTVVQYSPTRSVQSDSELFALLHE